MFFEEDSCAASSECDERDVPLSLGWQGVSIEVLRKLAIRRSKYDDAYAGVIACLLVAHRIGRWVSYSRNRCHYTGMRRYAGQAYTYAVVIEIVDVLLKLGLIEEDRKKPFNFGTQSRMRASSRLCEMLGTEIEPVPIVLETIRLKNAEKRYVDYEDSELTHRLRGRIKTHNEAISSLQIAGLFAEQASGVLACSRQPVLPSMRQLYRVFNIDFLHGGRLYGGFWQNLPSEHRAQLTINGQSVIELDYQHLHPELLYASFGQPLSFDAYSIEGVNRSESKIAFQMLLNCTSKRSAIHAVAFELRRREPALDARESEVRARTIVRSLEVRHGAIEPAFYQVVGRRLQKIDSELLLSVMDRCLAANIIGLPVHDSLIVPQQCAVAVRGIMCEELDKMRALLGRIRLPGLLNSSV